MQISCFHVSQQLPVVTGGMRYAHLSGPAYYEGENAMSIWMLLMFAVSCLLAVLAFGPQNTGGPLPEQLFAATFFAFLLGLVARGIRRPVC